MYTNLISISHYLMKMTAQAQSQILYDLEFYLWRVRYLPKEEWREEILVKGSRKAFDSMLNALISMREEFQKYGKSTRKFLCNPPEEIDVIQYAKEHNVEVQWLNWLIIKMDLTIHEEKPYELREKNVTIWFDESTLERFLNILRIQIDPKTQFPQKQTAPGGLFFSSDWLGAK